MFPRIFKKLRETGQLKPQYQDRGGRRSAQTPDVEEAVFDRVVEEPSISTRAIAREMGVAHGTDWKVQV